MTDETPPILTPEQQKAVAMSTFNQLHTNIVTFIKQLAIPQVFRLYSDMNLDQGADWIRKGINEIQFTPIEPPKKNDSEESTPTNDQTINGETDQENPVPAA